jgi:hypothetical protein
MKTKILILTIILGTSLSRMSFAQEIKNSSGIFVYDYVPDLILDYGADTIKIDINQDSIKDIVFYLDNSSGGGYCYVKSLSCQYAFLSSVNSNSLKNDSLHWFNSDHVWQSSYGSEVGLKFGTGDSCYYGWLLGNVYWAGYGADGKRTLAIDKYAFCSIPNYPLLWGQTEITGIEILKDIDKIRVVANGSGQAIIVQTEETIKSIKLLNLSGVVIKTWDNVQSKKTTLNTSGLTHGTYFVQVSFSGKRIFTEKIVL